MARYLEVLARITHGWTEQGLHRRIVASIGDKLLVPGLETEAPGSPKWGVSEQCAAELRQLQVAAWATVPPVADAPAPSPAEPVAALPAQPSPPPGLAAKVR